MFSSTPNYNRLKTNLKLGITRLKLLGKKKMELAQKSRKEIADYISEGKIERAKIRVEHIIREDYMVEGMEMLEMYCDLLLARMGLIQQMRALDSSLEEAVSTVLYAGPRVAADAPELRIVCDQLTTKYGREYSDACRDGRHPTISVKLKYRMGMQAPSKVLVEKYLVEISNNFHVHYEPDEEILKRGPDGNFIDFEEEENAGPPDEAAIVEPPGFKGFPPPPMLPQSDFLARMSPDPENESSTSTGGGFVVPPAADTPHPGYTSYGVPLYYPLPMDEEILRYTRIAKNYETRRPIDCSDYPVFEDPRDKLTPPDEQKMMDLSNIFAELPSVPTHQPRNLLRGDDASKENQVTSVDMEFEELSKRFEELKRKK